MICLEGCIYFKDGFCEFENKKIYSRVKCNCFIDKDGNESPKLQHKGLGDKNG